VKLITLATSSPNSPLGLIWKHAFEQGLQEGFKRGAAFFKDMDVKQAFCEGADQGQIVGILAERGEWEIEGHGQWCFDKLLTCVLCDAGFCDVHVKLDAAVQVDSVGPPPPPSIDVAIQVEATQSVHSSASQTDPPPLFIDAKAQVQPISKPITTTATIVAPSSFDWSEDAVSIPVTPIFPKSQPICDLSALRTSNPNPFSSLAHQNRHSQLPLDNCDIYGSWPPFQPCQAPPHLPVSQSTTHQQFIPISVPIAPVPSILALDWESDPCLSDLSQALKALGWIHQ